MSDSFGSAIERGEKIINYHANSKMENPYYKARRMESMEEMEDDPILINYSALKALVAMSKRYIKVAETINPHNWDDGYN